MSKNFDEALNKLTMEEVLARNAGEKVVADRLHNIRQLLIRDAQQGNDAEAGDGACICKVLPNLHIILWNENCPMHPRPISKPTASAYRP